MKSTELDRLDRRRLVVSSAILGGAAMLSSAKPLLSSAATKLPADNDVSVARASGGGLRQGNATRAAAIAAQYDMEVAWSLELDSALSYQSSFVQVGDTLYFATNETIFALDATTGTEIWRFVAPRRGTGLNVVDEVVYFGIPDDYLYAVDAHEGTVIWRFEDSGDCSFPQVVDGVVYFGSGDGYLYSLDAEEGSERWRFDTPNVVVSPLVVDGTVYCGLDDRLSIVYAINAEDGTKLWEFGTRDGEYSGLSYPVVGDGVACFKSSTSIASSLYVLDSANGQELWSIGFVDIVDDQDVHFGDITDFALVDGVVYLTGGYEARICAFDAQSGRKLWETPSTDENDDHYLASVSDGVVYVHDIDYLYAFDAGSGTLSWSTEFLSFNAGAGLPTILDFEDQLYIGYRDFVFALDKKSHQEIWRYSTEGGDSYYDPILLMRVGSGLVYCEFENPHRLNALRPAAPSLKPGGTARVTEMTSLRGGPSPTAVVRAELEPNTLVTLTGEAEMAGSVEWWPVSVNETGAEGWIEASSLAPAA